jgi:hypothetical protein
MLSSDAPMGFSAACSSPVTRPTRGSVVARVVYCGHEQHRTRAGLEEPALAPGGESAFAVVRDIKASGVTTLKGIAAAHRLGAPVPLAAIWSGSLPKCLACLGRGSL